MEIKSEGTVFGWTVNRKNVKCVERKKLLEHIEENVKKWNEVSQNDPKDEKAIEGRGKKRNYGTYGKGIWGNKRIKIKMYYSEKKTIKIDRRNTKDLWKIRSDGERKRKKAIAELEKM